MLVIAGGILLAIILLPLLAPALFIGLEFLRVALPIAGVVIAVAVAIAFYEDHELHKKAEEERLSKMTKEEIEAEKKREKEQRKEDLRPGIRAAGITFVAVFLFAVISTKSVIAAVVMSVIFSAVAFYMGMTIH